MLNTYTWPRYACPAPPRPQPRVPLVVVGAGPVGLALAIDLAQRGQRVLLLDDDHTVSLGSRAVCHARHTLEIFDRLGIGDAVVAQGVTWNVGRTFHGEHEVFSFDLAPEPGHQRPGMVNLQQYHLEQRLVERAQALPGIDLRWGHKVVGLEHGARDDTGLNEADGTPGATLHIDTADGRYTLHADWLVVADGARSPCRRLLGLDSTGQVFQDRFLIADVVLTEPPFAADRTERRFWFHPPFHARHSALMHRQPDGVWRIDFQLGWDADPEAEKQPERVTPRIRALLDQQGFGHIGFTLEWLSVYTFQCRRMARFRHGRVLFAGDAAHQVSPFGARGGNSGVQDAANLGWKLDLVQRGLAPDTLLDSYHTERAQAADENLRHSSRSTDFMTPKSHASRVLQAAVLGLAAQVPAAQVLVNSGRLSVPTAYADSPLNTPDSDAFEGWMQPGAPADDAPLEDAPAPGDAAALAEVAAPSVAAPPAAGWLLRRLPPGFTLLCFSDAARPDPAQADALHALAGQPIPVAALHLPLHGLAARRYDARPGTTYLLRPDRHVAARWRTLNMAAVRAAVARASGLHAPAQSLP